MKYLFSLASLMAVSMPAQAETVYLLIKNTGPNGTSAFHSIPMTSEEQCEEAGALIISSKRFSAVAWGSSDGFECIRGK